MTEDMPSDIPAPSPPATPLTADEARLGRRFPPQVQIRMYSAEEWEGFVEEWAYYSIRPRYDHVQRFGGPGDRGIDIAGFTSRDRLRGVWDCYQCKRFSQGPLALPRALVDIGKVLWYTFNDEYRPPRSYSFVTPHGVTTELANCLSDADRLKAELRRRWDATVRTKITDMQAIDLSGRFRNYVENFDLSLFDSKTGLDLVQEHRSCPYHAMRFGGGLPPRPAPEQPPLSIALTESRYVAQLLAAYRDHKKQDVRDPGALKAWPPLARHFARQREAFYKADSLRVFSRDTVPPGTFEALEEEIYNGVIDIHDADHPDGYGRVRAVTRAARELAITANVLITCSDGTDRTGICHHLANKDRLRWTTE